jgi:predicted DNA-binding protein (UPF0251 family)
MADIHINDLLKEKTQAEVGQIMGITQGAVHQMVKAGRDIYFHADTEGRYTYHEIKKPRRRADQAA